MREIDDYVQARLRSGGVPLAVFHELTGAGWPPAEVDASIRSYLTAPAPPAAPAIAPHPVAHGAPASEPARTSRPLLIVSIVLAAASSLPLLIIVLAAGGSQPGVRGALAGVGEVVPALLWTLAALVPVWIGSLVCFLIARRKPAGGSRGLTWWALASVVTAPVLSALLVLGTFAYLIVFGVMCGEAVNETCGL